MKVSHGSDQRQRTKTSRKLCPTVTNNSNTLRRYASYICLLLFFSTLKFLVWHFFFSPSPTSVIEATSTRRLFNALNDTAISDGLVFTFSLTLSASMTQSN